jgi:CTP:molybdopterin cytidylyltransferase MocA
MVTCILLSAGLSERFGSPKALARLADTTTIEKLQNTLLQSRCEEIIVVLGAYADQIEPFIFKHSRIHVVYNKDYFLGQTSSVQAGWRKANPTSTGIMFLPVDCPLVKPRSIDAVIDHFNKHQPDILIPSYQGKKGHPPIFHQRLTSAVLDLPTDLGLNSLFAAHPPRTLEIDDPGIIKSFNTPEEFKKIK